MHRGERACPLSPLSFERREKSRRQESGHSLLSCRLLPSGAYKS